MIQCRLVIAISHQGSKIMFFTVDYICNFQLDFVPPRVCCFRYLQLWCISYLCECALHPNELHLCLIAPPQCIQAVSIFLCQTALEQCVKCPVIPLLCQSACVSDTHSHFVSCVGPVARRLNPSSKSCPFELTPSICR